MPRIYQKEARSISRPLIFEQTPPWSPKINAMTEPVMRLPEPLPGISGLVLTSPKENELVEIPIVSPLPAGQTNVVLAHWTYGLGRSVAFTSDAGRRWAKSWPDWQSYSAFWSQVVRWSMRPADRGNLTLNVRREQGRIKVVIDALDKENQFLNFLRIQGNVVTPDLKRSSIELVQTAPGRYEATVENVEASGNYFVNLGYRGPDNVQGVISSGVSVPYSDEYRELRSNPTTLETLATLTDGQVVNWKFRPDGRVDLPHTLAGVDHFRRNPGLVNPRSFAPCGRHSSGWRPACSSATWPSAALRWTWIGSASWRSTSGGSSAARTRPRPAITWRSSRAARPRSTSSSIAPAPPRRGSRRAGWHLAVVSGHAHLRIHRRTPARRRRGPRADQIGRAEGPGDVRRAQGGREGELHQPPAQGQATRLGRAGEGQQG